MFEFPQEAGYPIGGEFATKYFMVQIHFDNSHLASSTNIFTSNSEIYNCFFSSIFRSS